MARFLTAFSLQHQKMSQKTLFRKYLAKRYVAYKERHTITLNDMNYVTVLSRAARKSVPV